MYPYILFWLTSRYQSPGCDPEWLGSPSRCLLFVRPWHQFVFVEYLPVCVLIMFQMIRCGCIKLSIKVLTAANYMYLPGAMHPFLIAQQYHLTIWGLNWNKIWSNLIRSHIFLLEACLVWPFDVRLQLTGHLGIFIYRKKKVRKLQVWKKEINEMCNLNPMWT